MNDDGLAREFDEQRQRLRAVAGQLLGGSSDAHDAVQEAWIRLQRADVDTIDNLGGWLTTVVSRISLDMLRTRAVRLRTAERADREPAAGAEPTQRGPEFDAELADGVGAALTVVLDTLNPAERVAFVLHDTFDVPFNDIAAMLGRSPAAAKQLASRARSKVQGTSEWVDVDRERNHEVVEAFLDAARGARLVDLVAALAPDIELHADPAGIQMGAPALLVGAEDVAQSFSGRALGAKSATIDGVPGMVWIVGNQPKVGWEFTIQEGRVTRIDMVADADTLVSADIAMSS